MIGPTSVHESLDGAHVVKLTGVGEIHFGPPYFGLSIDGRALWGRIFSDNVLWSPDSRLFAVREWLAVSTSFGPLMRIDPKRRIECAIAEPTSGFPNPESFDSGQLVYSVLGESENSRCKLRPKSEWTTLQNGLFACSRQKPRVQAMGHLEDPHRFRVLAGAAAAGHPQHGVTRRLVTDGVLRKRRASYAFVRDHVFASPSAAASMILGYRASGWERWKNEYDRPLSDFFPSTMMKP